MHRESDLSGTHPFRRASFEIWAPEEDTAEYYGRSRPMAFGGMAAADAALEADDGFDAAPKPRPRPLPPAGVDVGAFYDLVEQRANGYFANALAIDKARNNTSLVFVLEWEGWRLLFAGDAEIRSWRTMERKGVLAPVDFLKVSHHGSHNGTPSTQILDQVLPRPAAGEKHGWALISTCADTYNRVPHAPTTAELERRCKEVLSTEDYEDWIDLDFPA